MHNVKRMWNLFLDLFRLSYFTMETLLDKGGQKRLIFMMVGLLVAWHIYTPVHELLHVAGCVMSGGTVQELALKPQYGGTILKEIFPFIVPESDYAGQLTGFTTPNKWSYAIVDLLPFILSLFGAQLMFWCRKKQNTWLFGLALILAFVPFMSLTGDFFEAASLITSEGLSVFQPELGTSFLVSDDAFKLVGSLWETDQLGFTVTSFLILTVCIAMLLIFLLSVLQIMLVKWINKLDCILPVGGNLPESQE